MKQITQTGTTVESAISAALEKLQVKREEVTINVIQTEKKGFLGFGSKKAEVEVKVNDPAQPAIGEEQLNVLPETVETETIQAEIAEETSVDTRERAIQETKDYIISIAEGMKINDLKISHEQRGKNVSFYLESEKVAMLIGKRGQTLNSLQQLAQLVANKYSNQFLMIELDAENYRERRQETLEQLADRMADKAIRTGGRVQFEPMPSYERKVIHQALSRRLDIETYSEGKDPNRYLVIEPLK
ncbi:RNA-binding cell elongation regulator Jag/EloR [Planococcus shixiaomingii]|uniref:RNA-binding cell elongation regulator Jag/EloR n=1 Tax=Planococcus shixiaomingii TaxID=3058393 RepID=UPI00261CAB99|nr:RNA-binding cell elongation regulator Jag/EloR [Planococcus sp. N022]WKA54823.1 RNA-binding cell elongation regulator Jag/EloR [Planococcus sp. N022]